MKNLMFLVIVMFFISVPAYSAWIEYRDGIWIRDDYQFRGNNVFVTYKYDSNSKTVSDVKYQHKLNNLDYVIADVNIDCSNGIWDVNYNYLNRSGNPIIPKVHMRIDSEKSKPLGFEMCSYLKNKKKNNNTNTNTNTNINYGSQWT